MITKTCATCKHWGTGDSGRTIPARTGRWPRPEERSCAPLLTECCSVEECHEDHHMTPAAWFCAGHEEAS